MSSAAKRAYSKNIHTLEVERFCSANNFTLTILNNGFQLRIEDMIDIYPVNRKWHWLLSGERGTWQDVDDLRKIMLKRIPKPPMQGNHPNLTITVDDAIRETFASPVYPHWRDQVKRLLAWRKKK